AQAIQWGLVAALSASAVPFVYIVRGVRRRRLTDRHVSVRQQRPLPLLVAIGSIIVGLVLMTLLGAPKPMIALVAAMTVGLIVSLTITLVWKISVHAAVLSGAVVIVILVFGVQFAWLVVLVPLVGWARLQRADHNPAQVAAGAIIGAAIAAGVFIPLQ
ncbi:MAG: phosphoesterase PA-phosphatase, partial [Chloroflexota bacterium]